MTKFKRDRKHPLAGADLTSRNGADALCKVLTEYWTTRGYRGVRVERYELPGTVGGSYGVRSNMLNGWPRA